jgi:hypothetical protein
VSSLQDSHISFFVTQGSGCCAASTLGYAVSRFQRAEASFLSYVESHIRLHSHCDLLFAGSSISNMVFGFAPRCIMIEITLNGLSYPFELSEITGLGHFLMMKSPKDFNRQLMEFIDKLK